MERPHIGRGEDQAVCPCVTTCTQGKESVLRDCIYICLDLSCFIEVSVPSSAKLVLLSLPTACWTIAIIADDYDDVKDAVLI